MYGVYILKSSKDERTYVGYSQNVSIRLKEHNSGKVIATKNRRPFKLLFIEVVPTIMEAKRRELYWKSGAGRRKLTKFFKEGFPPIHLG